MKTAASFAILAGGIAVATAVTAAETVVDRHGRIDFGTSAVAPGDAYFIDPSAGSVTKSGSGEWTLPLGNFFALGTGFELGVLGGVINLSAGTEPDYVTTPPAVLRNDAAVWLAAGRNVATNADGDVTQWYDVRETAAAAAGYGYAEAYSTVLSDGVQGVATAVKDGRDAIAFRAYVGNSLVRSLELRTVAGAATSYTMYDGFYVVSPRGPTGGENQHAPILGNMTTGYFFSGGKGTGAMLSEEGNAYWSAYTATYRHNGMVEDPTARVDGSKCHLCEFTAQTKFAFPIDSICRDRNLASGGVYLHEFIIFTRPITPQERAEVTAYLMQKWNLDRGRITINLASGTEIRAGDELLRRVDLKGDPLVGTGDQAVYPSMRYSDRKLPKRYLVGANGGRLNVQGTEYTLQLADGDAVTIDDSLTTNRAVTVASGAAGTTSVAGAGRSIVFDQVPATKLTASTSEGDIILRPRTPAAADYTAGSAPATLSTTSVSIPAGTSGATATVTIPTAGDWEVEFDIQNLAEFKTGGSWTDGRNTSYRFSLVDHTNLLNKVVLTVKPSEIGGVVPHRRYLIRGLEAGEYTLKFAGYQNGTLAASVSNLAFVYVPNPAKETVVPVTEGDFESMAMNKAYFSSRDNLNATYTKWTIANGPGIGANPIVQSIVNSMMGIAVTSDGYLFQLRPNALGRYGDNAMMWIHTNSTASAVRNTATSPATVLPAGTWRLRMKACRMSTGNLNFTDKIGQNPVENNKRCGKALAKYQAAVKVNGGAPVDLGITDEIDSFREKTYFFPNSFTVSEGDSVVVDLDQLVGWSFSLTDDYEFVKVGDEDAAAGLGPELIVNGSFEDNWTGWTTDHYTDAAGEHRVDRQFPNGKNFGSVQCDGNYAARPVRAARCYQTLALEAGVYRLSYWSRARCDYVYGNADGTPCFQCRLHFWCVEEGGSVTNRIVDGDTLWSTNFYETVALFTVKTAGTYCIGFHKDADPGVDSLTDCVSVKKVLDAASVPDIDPAAELVFNPADGKVRLDYTGTLDVKVLRVKGKRYFDEVSSELYPDVFSGPGTINVTGKPDGTVLIFR